MFVGKFRKYLINRVSTHYTYSMFFLKHRMQTCPTCDKLGLKNIDAGCSESLPGQTFASHLAVLIDESQGGGSGDWKHILGHLEILLGPESLVTVCESIHPCSRQHSQ